MRPEFKIIVERLDAKFVELCAMSPITADTMPGITPIGGIYLFGTLQLPQYVGRTKQAFSKRIVGHVNDAPDSPFAFRLARVRTDRMTGQYTKKASRKALLDDPKFIDAYNAAKNDIRKMELRWVHESDPTTQALLEIYAATVLKTPHNDFDTH